MECIEKLLSEANVMTDTEALDLAKQIAADNGWVWLEPISVRYKKRWLRGSVWIINSNTNERGCNVHIEIDASSGRVINASFWPR